MIDKYALFRMKDTRLSEIQEESCGMSQLNSNENTPKELAKPRSQSQQTLHQFKPVSPFLSTADYWNHTPSNVNIAKSKIDLNSKNTNENYNKNYFNEIIDKEREHEKPLNVNNFMPEKTQVKRQVTGTLRRISGKVNPGVHGAGSLDRINKQNQLQQLETQGSKTNGWVKSSSVHLQQPIGNNLGFTNRGIHSSNSRQQSDQRTTRIVSSNFNSNSISRVDFQMQSGGQSNNQIKTLDPNEDDQNTINLTSVYTNGNRKKRTFSATTDLDNLSMKLMQFNQLEKDTQLIQQQQQQFEQIRQLKQNQLKMQNQVIQFTTQQQINQPRINSQLKHQQENQQIQPSGSNIQQKLPVQLRHQFDLGQQANNTLKSSISQPFLQNPLKKQSSQNSLSFQQQQQSQSQQQSQQQLMKRSSPQFTPIYQKQPTKMNKTQDEWSLKVAARQSWSGGVRLNQMTSNSGTDQAMHARLKMKAEEAKNILEQQQQHITARINSAGTVNDIVKPKQDMQTSNKQLNFLLPATNKNLPNLTLQSQQYTQFQQQQLSDNKQSSLQYQPSVQAKKQQQQQPPLKVMHRSISQQGSSRSTENLLNDQESKYLNHPSPFVYSNQQKRTIIPSFRANLY